MKEMLSNPLHVMYNLVQVSNMSEVSILCHLLFCNEINVRNYPAYLNFLHTHYQNLVYIFQRTVNGTNTETGANAVLLVVAELIIERERKSKKLNMVDKIVQETLEKRLLATHITVQVHTNRFSFRYENGCAIFQLS